MEQHVFQTVNDAFKAFERFANFERTPGDSKDYQLERMRALLSAFRQPQASYASIHIAGSKGKGSTAHFIGNMLYAAGYRVGLYASPHLIDYRERISTPRGPFPDKIYITVLSMLFDWASGLYSDPEWVYGEPTTFELLTLAAFILFQKTKIQWAVVETGLGGRLDATNCIEKPEACVITPIELEHTEILGDTLEKIAAEKAGIFKKNAILWTQIQPPSVIGTLTRFANNSELNECPKAEWIVRNGTESYLSFVLPISNTKIESPAQVLGGFQAGNAALAASVIESLWSKGKLPMITNFDELTGCIIKGIATTAPPGRLSVYTTAVQQDKLPDKTPVAVLDVSHTPNSVKEAMTVVKGLWPDRKIVLLFGSVSGKRHDEMAAILAPHCESIWITTPGTFKASEPENVFAAFKLHGPASVYLEKNTQSAFEHAFSRSMECAGCLLICGSFYLSGLIAPLLIGKGFGIQTETRKSQSNVS